MGKLLTQEEYLRRVTAAYPYLRVMEPYVKATAQIKAKCTKCGLSFVRVAVQNHLTGCPRCRGTGVMKRRRPEDYLVALKEKAPHLHPVEPYRSMNAPLKVRCDRCKQTYSRSARHHLDRECSGCVRKKTRTRNQKLAYLIEKAGGECAACGYNDHPNALDFHHRHPKQRRFGLTLSNMGKEWDTLVEEARRCVLLCANCHRTLHYGDIASGSYSVKAQRKKKRALVNMRGGACEGCGRRVVYAAYDFHHVDPRNKRFGICQAVTEKRSWDDVLEEMKACVVLCANCHREVHAGIRKVGGR